MLYYCCFFFNVTATTGIYTYGHTLSLHDALPITGSRSGTTWPNVALSVTVPAPSSPAWRAGAVSERIENLAERILNAAESSLRHYTMQSTRGAILAAERGAYMAGWKDGYDDALDTEKGEGCRQNGRAE